MQSIPRTPVPDKVILIHHGALGDFLTVWPSAWAVSKAFPSATLLFHGPGERMRWMAPLGYSPCPPGQRRALEGLHAAERWPRELEGFTCLWFVVDKVPSVPAGPGLAFLKAVHDGPGGPHVRRAYALALERLGVLAGEGWAEAFRSLFAGSRRHPAPSHGLLLIPGAGHPLKQWPLVQFFQLARMAQSLGLEPLFVLGPAEAERGLSSGEFACVRPQNLEELEEIILSARFVVGGDTGPMHLAGMLGVPGVSLFGPTSFAQWGPPGLEEMSLGLPCSPCTATCASLSCEKARCLAGIEPGMVLERLAFLENQIKTGFQGPGIP